MKQSVVCILIVEEKLLLIQRRDISIWVLPGGGVEPGETPEAAAVREMQEETGLSVRIIRKIAEYTPINRLAYMTHFFEVKVVSGDLAIGPETKDIRFFLKDKLPKKVPPPYHEWIADAFLQSPDVIRKKLTSVTYQKLVILFLQHPFLIIRFLLGRIGIHFNGKSPHKAAQ